MTQAAMIVFVSGLSAIGPHPDRPTQHVHFGSRIDVAERDIRKVFGRTSSARLTKWLAIRDADETKAVLLSALENWGRSDGGMADV